MTTESFNNELEFDASRVKTKVVIETSFSKEIRILLSKGQIMKEHKTPFPILIHILEGEIMLGVKGTAHIMRSGDIIALDGDVPHDLTAKENTIVRLSLSKHDRVERLKDVLHN
ncbi:MAG: cupin domain-containing protein [Sporocytophaga sp.]|uniref:cupin domain-containing protein n=1 Tax=Sporocytophaga sp. TaxID=2231183 RepID=UPI001B087A0D|nr:cupin domain-containing protein [Sporocytophaga sp.]MBO9698630.1 cupin domain-containing protein [Sporocytophaga sp.]